VQVLVLWWGTSTAQEPHAAGGAARRPIRTKTNPYEAPARKQGGLSPLAADTFR
jgi:hypothetical protein